MAGNIRMRKVTIKSIVFGSILLLLIDSPWLYINQTWASRMIENIQGSPISLRILPSILVYVLLSYLLTIPKSYEEAFLMGSAVYGVYDATNYATIKKYSLKFAIADTIWGGILLSTAWWVRENVFRF